MVYEAFVGDILEGMEINHKDENPTNNQLSNLMVCNHSQNMNWGTRNKRISNNHINGKKSKPVIQYDNEGNIIKEWPSIREIERQLDYSISAISDCCNNKKYCKSYKGYI